MPTEVIKRLIAAQMMDDPEEASKMKREIYKWTAKHYPEILKMVYLGKDGTEAE